MKQTTIEIRAFDKTIHYEKINQVYIFTSNYRRKIGKNEFHNPGAARIIFESENKIMNLLFVDLFVSTNDKGDILIRTMNLWDKITQIKPYYSLSNLNKARQLFIIYQTKGLETLEPEEIFEYSWAKEIIEVLKVKSLKIPFYIGGGF